MSESFNVSHHYTARANLIANPWQQFLNTLSILNCNQAFAILAVFTLPLPLPLPHDDPKTKSVLSIAWLLFYSPASTNT